MPGALEPVHFQGSSAEPQQNLGGIVGRKVRQPGIATGMPSAAVTPMSRSPPNEFANDVTAARRASLSCFSWNATDCLLDLIVLRHRHLILHQRREVSFRNRLKLLVKKRHIECEP